MRIRYLVIAGLLASAAGAQAEVIGSVPPGPIGATPGVVHTPMPAALTLDGATPATPAIPATPATPAVPGVSPAVPATPAVPAIPATPANPAEPVVTLPTAPVAVEVPEPSSIALLLAGAIGVGALRRRRAKQA